jgi:ElaB/YqjD/DUF883 family membrane-anchored ribosome-binding protein
MLEHTAASSAALAEELRNVVHQAEELLHAVSEDGNEAIHALRERVYGAVDNAKTRLADLEQEAQRASMRVASAAETYIRDHPWVTVGVAVGVGVLLGALLARGKGSNEAVELSELNE